MNAEHRASVVYTDSERLEKFLIAFPELHVREIYETLITVGLLSEPHHEMISEYFLTIGHSALFSFNDQRIQKAYERFNHAAEALDEYMSLNLFPMPMGVHFSLYPDHKHGTPEQKVFWEKCRFELETLARDFVNAYGDLLSTAVKCVSGSTAKRSLKGAVITFDETLQAIIVDGVPYKLPNAKNEVSFVRVMLDRAIGQPVDWPIIFEEMTGNEASTGNKKIEPVQRKSVNDTLRRLNQRVKDMLNTQDNLLEWDNKCVTRNF